MFRQTQLAQMAILAVLVGGGCTEKPPSTPAGSPIAAAESPPADDQPALPDVDPTAAATQSQPPLRPRFHGPRGDNISTDTGLLTQWPEAGPELVWTAEGIGQGFSSVTLSGGLIFTAGNIRDKMMVTALDLNGEIRWQTENGEAWSDSPGGSRGTPTIDGNRVYHESPRGSLICLNATNGEKIWRMNILNAFEGENITWALSESVLIDGGQVICSPGGKKTAVVSFSKMTGQPLWTTPSAGDKAGYASPTLIEYEGLRIILAMTSAALIGVDAEDGELLFRFEHRTKYDVNATDPLYHEGQIFISSGYGSGSAMLKLNVDGEKVSVEQLWESKDLDNQHGGVILHDGYLYGASHNVNNAKWVCLDWETGELKYAERGVGKGSVALADGLLYTLSENRAVGLVEPTPEGHEVISRFKIPDQGEGPTWAHPVVCGGRLYIRHDNYLYAYDVQAN